MHKTVLRWGLLSTAHINRALIPPLRVSKRSKLAAVASRNMEKAEAYAKGWSIPKAYGSYEALLEDPEIDVIYNSLPNKLHAIWTVKALQAGKHVLCEKPLAMSVDEVDEVISAARQYGRVVAEAFMYRHHPQTLKAKELVSRGAIGEVRLLRGAFTYNLSRPNDVRLDDALGGGSIWDVGCYPINYFRYLTGSEPESVFGQQVTGPGGIDMTFAGLMRFPGNVMAQFESSFDTAFKAFIEVSGTNGNLLISDPYKPGMWETIKIQRGERIERVGVRGRQLYIGEVEDMADAILDGKPPRISLEDSRGNIQTIQRLIESARQNKYL